MSTSDEEKEFVSYLVEMMQSIGPVSAKSMFGGHGIFLNGLMFGLVADGVLYFKASKNSEEAFKSRDLGPFIYNKKGKEVKMSYFKAPDEVLEDGDEMEVWGKMAYGAALESRGDKNKN